MAEDEGAVPDIYVDKMTAKLENDARMMLPTDGNHPYGREYEPADTRQ